MPTYSPPNLADNVSCTVAIAHAAGSTSLTVNAPSNPFPAAPFRLTCVSGANVVVYMVSAVAGNTLTVAPDVGYTDINLGVGSVAEVRVTMNTFGDIVTGINTISLTPGPQGYQGLAGTQGNQGARGYQGYQGNTGGAGTAGSQGFQGFQGFQGSQGVQGNTGGSGPQGSQGYQGTGYQGFQGSNGSTGPQGYQGFQGSQGNQGYQGVSGVGSQGAQGYQGAQSTVAGPQGYQGFQGVAGGGSSLAIGSAITSSTSGSVLYVNSSQLAQDNANHFWDATNHRLGIGTTTPQTAIDTGTGLISGGTSSASYRNTLNLSSNVLPYCVDTNFGNGAVFRACSTGVLGTTPDVFFQALPNASTGYGYLETYGGAGLALGTGGGSTPILFRPNRTTRGQVTGLGSWVLNTAALSTTATDGFTYLPTCAGTPTGTPTTQTGTCATLIDTTNSKLWSYIGSAWKSVTLS